MLGMSCNCLSILASICDLQIIVREGIVRGIEFGARGHEWYERYWSSLVMKISFTLLIL